MHKEMRRSTVLFTLILLLSNSHYQHSIGHDLMNDFFVIFRFGNGKRGDRLAHTLQKLHEAYREGVVYKRKEELGELDNTEDEEEEEELKTKKENE